MSPYGLLKNIIFLISILTLQYIHFIVFSYRSSILRLSNEEHNNSNIYSYYFDIFDILRFFFDVDVVSFDFYFFPYETEVFRICYSGSII